MLGLLAQPEALAAAAIVAQGVGLDVELEDGSGVLSGLGIDKETAEANISAWLDARVKGAAGQG